MPRLIDAEALLFHLADIMRELPTPMDDYADGYYGGLDKVFGMIEKAQTIDPESLRPHGRWEFFDFASPTVECSICGALAGWNVAEEYHSDRTNFCPNCGAKMDGDLDG